MMLDVYSSITCSEFDYRFIRLNIKFGKSLIISIISAQNVGVYSVLVLFCTALTMLSATFSGCAISRGGRFSPLVIGD